MRIEPVDPATAWAAVELGGHCSKDVCAMVSGEQSIRKLDSRQVIEILVGEVRLGIDYAREPGGTKCVLK